MLVWFLRAARKTLRRDHATFYVLFLIGLAINLFGALLITPFVSSALRNGNPELSFTADTSCAPFNWLEISKISNSGKFLVTISSTSATAGRGTARGKYVVSKIGNQDVIVGEPDEYANRQTGPGCGYVRIGFGSKNTGAFRISEVTHVRTICYREDSFSPLRPEFCDEDPAELTKIARLHIGADRQDPFRKRHPQIHAGVNELILLGYHASPGADGADGADGIIKLPYSVSFILESNDDWITRDTSHTYSVNFESEGREFFDPMLGEPGEYAGPVNEETLEKYFYDIRFSTDEESFHTPVISAFSQHNYEIRRQPFERVSASIIGRVITRARDSGFETIAVGQPGQSGIRKAFYPRDKDGNFGLREVAEEPFYSLNHSEEFEWLQPNFEKQEVWRAFAASLMFGVGFTLWIELLIVSIHRWSIRPEDEVTLQAIERIVDDAISQAGDLRGKQIPGRGQAGYVVRSIHFKINIPRPPTADFD